MRSTRDSLSSTTMASETKVSEVSPQIEEAPQTIVNIAELARKVGLQITGTFKVEPVQSEAEKAQTHEVEMFRLRSAVGFGAIITVGCIYILVFSQDAELKHNAYIGLSLVGAAGGVHLFGKSNLMG